MPLEIGNPAAVPLVDLAPPHEIGGVDDLAVWPGERRQTVLGEPPVLLELLEVAVAGEVEERVLENKIVVHLPAVDELVVGLEELVDLTRVLEGVVAPVVPHVTGDLPIEVCPGDSFEREMGLLGSAEEVEAQGGPLSVADDRPGVIPHFGP